MLCLGWRVKKPIFSVFGLKHKKYNLVIFELPTYIFRLKKDYLMKKGRS